MTRDASVGGEDGLLNRALPRNRIGDALAHVAGATATLGALATGPEYVGWPTGAGPDGGFDFTIPNCPADADVHAPASAIRPGNSLSYRPRCRARHSRRAPSFPCHA